MTDAQLPDSNGRGPDVARNIDLLLVTYILYVLGFFTGVSTIVGVVIAYVKRGEVAGTWRESHYTWLIRTFWIGLAAGVVAMITLIIGIGFLVMIAIAVWFIVRLVKGWSAYAKEQPIDDVESWLFG